MRHRARPVNWSPRYDRVNPVFFARISSCSLDEAQRNPGFLPAYDILIHRRGAEDAEIITGIRRSDFNREL